jgi:hypothetical protein
MRNVFVRTDFRVLHRRAESVGRSDRPANRGFRPLVVVQQREQRGLTLRQASLSIRDIGSALGLSRGTVQRELDAAAGCPCLSEGELGEPMTVLWVRS